METTKTHLAGERTQTPWRYFKEANGTRFHITAREVGTPGNHFEDFATVSIQHEDKARLMASAPELLEMLQITLDRMTLHPERVAETNYRLARALIAKVKGGAA